MLHKMKILALLAISSLLLLSACGPKATFEGYRQMMHSYQGQHIDNLVKNWGPPDSQYTMSDGRKLYSFNVRQQEYQAYYDPVFSPGLGLGFGGRHFYGGYYMNMGGTRIRELYCRTNVITDKKGLIREFSFRGNACRALPAQTEAGRPTGQENI